MKLRIEWAKHAYQIIDDIAERHDHDLPALSGGQ
jgi:hypothetical protein